LTVYVDSVCSVVVQLMYYGSSWNYNTVLCKEYIIIQCVYYTMCVMESSKLL